MHLIECITIVNGIFFQLHIQLFYISVVSSVSLKDVHTVCSWKSCNKLSETAPEIL